MGKVTVKKAAEYLAVAPNTIRSWADAGFLKCNRHPINRYRMFDIRSLKALKKKIDFS